MFITVCPLEKQGVVPKEIRKQVYNNKCNLSRVNNE